MTCPFYVCDGRPECILGDDRAERHCGPRTYPAGPCTLDAIGRGEAWRACSWTITYIAHNVAAWLALDDWMGLGIPEWNVYLLTNDAEILLSAAGWSP
jgi:hypothetical protein